MKNRKSTEAPKLSLDDKTKGEELTDADLEKVTGGWDDWGGGYGDYGGGYDSGWDSASSATYFVGNGCYSNEWS